MELTQLYILSLKKYIYWPVVFFLKKIIIICHEDIICGSSSVLFWNASPHLQQVDPVRRAAMFLKHNI